VSTGSPTTKALPAATVPPSVLVPAYKTAHGQMFHSRIEDALRSKTFQRLKGRVNLVLTSPPFPLVRKKRYGNATGAAYLEWIESLATPLADLLADDGSIVVEIGNAWEPGVPVMSTLPLEALLAFKRAANLNLCQHVICHNPAHPSCRERSSEATNASDKSTGGYAGVCLALHASLCA